MEQIRREVGPDVKVAHAHVHQHGTINIPPAASSSYEEWLAQNEAMRRSGVGEEALVPEYMAEGDTG